MAKHKITLLPGDGIGPEVTAAVVQIIECAGVDVEWEKFFVGAEAISRFGDPLPQDVLDSILRNKVALKGPVTTPIGTGFASINVRLRKTLDLYANLRPVRTLPALIDNSTFKPDVIRGVDLLFVRELTGGTYFAKPKKIWETKSGTRAVDTTLYTEQEIERAVRAAFELARGRRKKVTSVDKANVMATSRLWRIVAERVAAQYPDVEFGHMLADACAMHLTRRPTDFDVIVTDNLFGDLLTDLSSMLAGSLGMLPSASLGSDTLGLYEPIHGSAPDIAGQQRANPIAMILSAAMMLRYSFGLQREADAVEGAVGAALDAGLRTADIAPPGTETLSTSAMGQAIIERIATSGRATSGRATSG